jgi:hypothetical protein
MPAREAMAMLYQSGAKTFAALWEDEGFRLLLHEDYEDFLATSIRCVRKDFKRQLKLMEATSEDNGE